MKRIFFAFLILIVLTITGCTNSTAPQSTSTNPIITNTTEQSNVGTATTSSDGSPVKLTLGTDYDNAVSVDMQLLLGLFKLNGTDLAITLEQASALLPLWKNYLALNQTSMPTGTAPEQGQPLADATPQAPTIPTVDANTRSQLDNIIQQVQDLLTPAQIQTIADLQITQETAMTIQQEVGISMGGQGQSSGNIGQPPTGSQPPQGTPPTGGTDSQPPALPEGSTSTDGNAPTGGQPPAMPNGQGGGIPGGGQIMPQMIEALTQYLEKISTGQDVVFSTQTAPTNSGATGDGISAPPGGSSNGSGLASTASGAYTVTGTTETQDGESYNTSNADQSAILVTNGGSLTLTNGTIASSGDSSSSDNSSFYGLNAVVLANSASRVDIANSTVTSSGAGANGVFAEGSGTTITLTDVTINATGQYAHGVMATNGGTMTLTNVDMSTSGASSGVIATDRGSGTITVTGGTIKAAGSNSPGIYSTGIISVSDATISSTGAESAVIEGANTINLTNTTLTSSMEDKWGVMIYQSMSGDAEGTEGTFNMSGGTLSNTATTGPLFYVTNSTGIINLRGVNVSVGSGTLVTAATGNWGTSGSNGGTVLLSADSQTLNGNLTADNISSITITMQNNSTLTGAIDNANTAKSTGITMDASSTWVVTADSFLTSFIDPGGISGSSITNITGNGFIVYYDPGTCPDLSNQTFTLTGGGYLKPVQ